MPSKYLLAYKAQVAHGLAVAKHLPLCGSLTVELDMYRPRAVGDVDNPLKATLDAGNGLLWLDDSQIRELRVRRHDDPERPRVEVLVVGQRWATKEEAQAHHDKRIQVNQRRKSTLSRRRAEKFRAVSSYIPGGAK